MYIWPDNSKPCAATVVQDLLISCKATEAVSLGVLLQASIDVIVETTHSTTEAEGRKMAM